jgi:hypothetical protein
MPQHPNFSPDHRTKVYRLAVLPELREVVLGTVNGVRSFGEPELRHIEPKEVA